VARSRAFRYDYTLDGERVDSGGSRLLGRVAATDVVHPRDPGVVLVPKTPQFLMMRRSQFRSRYKRSIGAIAARV